MEKFIVSARKYRPQTFDTVVGQDHITTTLKNAIRTGHLAHAFLFCGPRGVGKTTCARILAKTINCENPSKDGEACNECHSCKSFNEGTSMNIHELDAASNNSVEDIRSLVEQVRFAPQAGKYKVYIIDEVHMLSSSAFNAFLKTLEEPPPYAIFILATTEKHKILPTILSRCQIYYFKLMDCMLKQDLSGAMLLYDDINKKGFEGDIVLNGFAEFIRNLLVCKDEKVAVLLEAVESFREKYISTAKNIAPSFLVSALNIINEAEINYKAARNKRLHVELVIIKLCYLQQAIEISSDAGGISKKKVVESSLAFRTAAIKPLKVGKSGETRHALSVRESVRKDSFGGVGSQKSEAKLVIETSLVNEAAENYKSSEPQTSNFKPQTTKLSALDKIRKQVKGNGNNGDGSETISTPLELESLQAAWNEYV